MDISVENIMFCLDNDLIRVYEQDGFGVCNIWGLEFSFTKIEEESCLENFSTDEIAEMIVDVINHGEENGLCEEEVGCIKLYLLIGKGEIVMTLKQLKETRRYKWAEVIEAYDNNGEEIDVVDTTEYDDCLVAHTNLDCGFLSIDLA